MANSHITEDLLKDILVRLPVKSLMRFRCVHKSWSSLFQNPNFIAQQHLFRQTQTESSCLLVNRKHYVTKNYVLSFVPPDDDYDFNCGAFDLSQSLNLDLHFFKEDLRDLVIGPCINGIICLFEYPPHIPFDFDGNVDPHRIALWNPALREFKILPRNSVNILYYESYYIDGIGFGYDPKSNDYKVVRIVTFISDDDMILDEDSSLPPYQRPPLYEVYNLSTNSWRKIDPDFRGYVSGKDIGVEGQIYLNGAYYWWGGVAGVPGSACDQVIVSFNMSDEVFQIKRLPDLGKRYSNFKTLTELNNSIALVVNKWEVGIEKNFDIWVMRQYGVMESWTKQFTIGPISGVERSLGFGKNYQLLLVGQNEELVLCNTSGQKIKNLQVKDFKDFPDSLSIYPGVPHSLRMWGGVIYVESLFSINVIQK